MKKLVLFGLFVAALSFASCCGKCDKKEGSCCEESAKTECCATEEAPAEAESCCADSAKTECCESEAAVVAE